jgi:hypothetical protein
MPGESEFVEVYAGHIVDADFLKGLLEAEGIAVFLRNEAMGTIAPFYVEAAGTGAVKVVIQRENLDIAEPIVREFVENSQE